MVSPSTLADASSALGSGLGSGAVEGLKLNTTAIPVTNYSGLALVVGNLGNGLTSSFFGTADFASLLSSVTGSTQLSSAVVSAGKGKWSLAYSYLSMCINKIPGLGEGAAQGLQVRLNPGATKLRRRAAETATGSHMDSIAEGFTQSLSSSFLGSVDIQSLMSQATTSMANLTSQIAPALVAAGSGIGSGAAAGLGLQEAVETVTPPDADTTTTVHNFAYELTSSFLANGTVQALTTDATGLTGIIAPAAEGLGNGIGQGVAVGLGLQDANSIAPASGGTLETLTQNFAFGLTSNFLANGTLTKLVSAASILGNSSSFDLGSIDISKAAEGLAIGLVDGAGQSISNAGGVKAILSGTESADTAATTTAVFNQAVSFNDTVDGAATGFGYGLGGAAVNVVLEAIGKKIAPLGSSSTSSADLSTRDLDPMTTKSLSGDIQIRSLSRRTADLSGLLMSLNITATNALVQTVVDALSCEGVGGLVQVLDGLISTKTISTNLTIPPGILPNSTFTIVSGSNKFEVNPGQKSISVNGVSVIKLIILIVLHGN